jgi:hypothetical protein
VCYLFTGGYCTFVFDAVLFLFFHFGGVSLNRRILRFEKRHCTLCSKMISNTCIPLYLKNISCFTNVILPLFQVIYKLCSKLCCFFLLFYTVDVYCCAVLFSFSYTLAVVWQYYNCFSLHTVRVVFSFNIRLL